MAKHIYDDINLSIFRLRFWDLFLMKLVRNLASIKFQFMVFFVYFIADGVWGGKITPSLGLGFLSGGFITFASAKIYIRTKLTESEE